MRHAGNNATESTKHALRQCVTCRRSSVLHKRRLTAESTPQASNQSVHITYHTFHFLPAHALAVMDNHA